MSGACVSRATLHAADGAPIPTKQTSSLVRARAAAMVIISSGVTSGMRHLRANWSTPSLDPSPQGGGRRLRAQPTHPSPLRGEAGGGGREVEHHHFLSPSTRDANTSGPTAITLSSIHLRNVSRSDATLSQSR